MIRFSFMLYLKGLIVAICSNELHIYRDYVIKKLCPKCRTKMVKNQLNYYNCPKCFQEYFDGQLGRS